MKENLEFKSKIPVFGNTFFIISEHSDYSAGISDVTNAYYFMGISLRLDKTHHLTFLF